MKLILYIIIQFRTLSKIVLQEVQNEEPKKEDHLLKNSYGVKQTNENIEKNNTFSIRCSTII